METLKMDSFLLKERWLRCFKLLDFTVYTSVKEN